MKLRRFYILPGILVICLSFLVPLSVHAAGVGLPAFDPFDPVSVYAPFSTIGFANGSAGTHEGYGGLIDVNIVKMPTDGGIKEDIPDKFRARFDKWKTELLSTPFGRQQWEAYAGNKNFVLTIRVSDERGKGAGTDKFQWDDDGNFVGATITLGSELDDGYPTPVYYPVLNSLSPDASTYPVSGRILAATKFSHEIGHVEQTATANLKLVQLQNKLVPVYISIFLKNGFNVQDKKLLDLTEQMGGTPTQIWESREYWSEINAMLFLKERIGSEIYYCQVFNKIRHNLKEYSGEYERRFDQYPEYANSPCWK